MLKSVSITRKEAEYIYNEIKFVYFLYENFWKENTDKEFKFNEMRSAYKEKIFDFPTKPTHDDVKVMKEFNNSSEFSK